MNHWCKDLHLRCFQESWKHHYNLLLLFLYQINVILIICCYWLLQKPEKRKKSNNFYRLQIELFFLEWKRCPKYRPIKFFLCPYIRPGRINGILKYFDKDPDVSRNFYCFKAYFVKFSTSFFYKNVETKFSNRTSSN